MLRYRIVITFCLITIVNIGCATSYQKVDTALLEQHKSKTFKLGIIKAAGDRSFGSGGSHYIEYRKKALSNVSIAEICSMLNRTYSLNIDPNVNTIPKIVKEDKAAIEFIINGPHRDFSPPLGNNQKNEKRHPLRRDSIGKVASDFAVDITVGVATELTKVLATAYLLQAASENAYQNAYYGNLEYENESSFSGIKNDDEFPDVVNVTYSLNFGPPTVSSLNDVSFYYDIDISSSGHEVIKLHGIVGNIKVTTEDAYDNQAAIWNLYVDYAGLVSEALRKDLLKTAKK